MMEREVRLGGADPFLDHMTPLFDAVNVRRNEGKKRDPFLLLSRLEAFLITTQIY